MAIGTPATNEIFDPRTWQEWPAHEYRIYADDRAQIFAIVDEEDYQWALQWKWRPKASRGGRKKYLCRTTHQGTRMSRVQKTVWLHRAIAERAGMLPPDDEHTIIDHRNGNGFDCRRANLRYATPLMNRHNRNGCRPQ